MGNELTLMLVIGIIIFAMVAAWCRTLAEKREYRDTPTLRDAEKEAARRSRIERCR